MVSKLSKIVSFQQYFADVRKKSKTVIAIYICAYESSRFAVLEDGIDYGIDYYAMTQSLEDISV